MRRHRWMLEVAVLTLAAVWACVSTPADPGVLLPPSLTPEHYELTLDIRVDHGVFFGVVVISGLAAAETDVIVLHCKNLVFNDTTLEDTAEGRGKVKVKDIQQDRNLHRCHLQLSNSLKVEHEYRLRMEFMGIIGKDGVGLHNNFYNEGGMKHEVLITNVQPNYARALFPCFDEPHFKAHFLVKVTNAGFPTVISNMPVSNYTMNAEQNNRGWVEFEETPPMSTYQLVIVFCDYLSLTESTTNTAIWAPRSRLHEAQLALNVSVQALRHCESYFGVEYALPKLDHVALKDLNFMATENWGAITYKNDFLLWEEGVSTWTQRQMVCHVVTHEVIHQWIGNLVTTSWWNTTWLNEGVASFFQFYILDKIEPTGNAMETAFVIQIQQILREEALRDHKPLTNNEQFSQDTLFSQAFTSSTYLKGAAIIRMVFSLMTPDEFREAMVEYVSDNAYGAVGEGDLWQVLAAVTDLPEGLEAIMYSWTHQPGFPLVTVHRAQNGCLTLTQSNYAAQDVSDVRWTIPLTYTTSTELDFNVTSTLWFPEDKSVFDLGECVDQRDWVILNIRQAGYYRVNYDVGTWRALTYDLINCDLSNIHPVNRAQLLYDSLDLARHGLLEYTLALDLTRYLQRETEYLPWAAAVHGLNVLRTRLLRSHMFFYFQKYATSLIEVEFRRMSLQEPIDELLPELHRRLIVEFACTLRHPRCVKEAKDLAYLLMSGVPVRIPQDLKPILLCSAVRHGQTEVWHYVLKEYQEAEENDRWKYLLALACTSDKETLKRVLKDISDPTSFVKSPDERLMLFSEIGKQDDTLEDVLGMVLRRVDEVSQNFDMEVILTLIKSSVKPSLTQGEKTKMEALEHVIRQRANKKHIAVIDAIKSEIMSQDLTTAEYEAIGLWLSSVVKAEDTILVTTVFATTHFTQHTTPTDATDAKDIIEDTLTPPPVKPSLGSSVTRTFVPWPLVITYVVIFL